MRRWFQRRGRPTRRCTRSTAGRTCCATTTHRRRRGSMRSASRTKHRRRSTTSGTVRWCTRLRCDRRASCSVACPWTKAAPPPATVTLPGRGSMSAPRRHDLVTTATPSHPAAATSVHGHARLPPASPPHALGPVLGPDLGLDRSRGRRRVHDAHGPRAASSSVPPACRRQGVRGLSPARMPAGRMLVLVGGVHTLPAVSGAPRRAVTRRSSGQHRRRGLASQSKLGRRRRHRRQRGRRKWSCWSCSRHRRPPPSLTRQQRCHTQ